MTLRTLEDTLPNGFHDAKLGEVTFDFITRSARLKLKILISLPDIEAETGVLYREIGVQLTGLLGIHLRSEYMKHFEKSEDRWLQIQGFVPTAEELVDIRAMSGIPLELTYGFFVHDWNQSIYLAAEAAALN